jgi:hypothetical protein
MSWHMDDFFRILPFLVIAFGWIACGILMVSHIKHRCRGGLNAAVSDGRTREANIMRMGIS